MKVVICQRSVVGLILAAVLLPLCSPAEAQQTKKVPRIGMVVSNEANVLLSSRDSTTLAILRAKTYGLSIGIARANWIGYLAL